MESQTIFATLREALAELYPEEQHARIVVHDAGLVATKIAFDSRAQTNWHHILAEAVIENRLDALLQVTRKDYSNSQTLIAAYGQYRHFIEQGGRIEPPVELPVASDIVQQIKTNGGTTITGNLNTDGGDFINRDKIVHINQLLPSPRKPLERPSRAEHFVDREIALVQLLADLQPGRVVALCGPGGIGKTALAAEAVWQLAAGTDPPEHFPDGILFHSFYNRSQVTLAMEHIARSFGEELTSTPLEAAQRALAGRQALLLFDGAEEADDLSTLLSIRNRCGVLVTSRQRKDALAIRLDLVPLPTDDAVSLLQAWGRHRAADATAVRRISELVGRLPLAIRLVGRYLTQTEENAIDYLAWLEATPLAALDLGQRQHDSIPLLLERSLTKVSETARQILSILGLLSIAPCQRDIIAEVLNLSPDETSRFLGELVNYSLLQRNQQSYEVSHALIHTYARLTLAPSIEIIIRVASYYEVFFKANPSNLTVLDSVRLHVLALVQSCVVHQIWATTDLLASAIEEYLDLRGYATDQVTISQAAIKSAQALQDRQKEGNWLGIWGIACDSLGQTVKAIKLHKQALHISRKIGDRRGESIHLGNLGNAYSHLGNVEKAIKFHQHALRISRELGDWQGESTHLTNLGNKYDLLGKGTQAIKFHQRALRISQAIGDRRGESLHLGNLGNVYADLKDMEKAIDYYERSLHISRELGDRRSESTQLGNLGNIYTDLKDMEKAINLHEDALRISREIGYRQGESTHLGNLGNAYANLEDIEKAIDYYKQAGAISHEIGDRYRKGGNLANLGRMYSYLGQLKEAKQAWEEAIHIFEAIKSPTAEKVRKWLALL